MRLGARRGCRSPQGGAGGTNGCHGAEVEVESSIQRAAASRRRRVDHEVELVGDPLSTIGDPAPTADGVGLRHFSRRVHSHIDDEGLIAVCDWSQIPAEHRGLVADASAQRFVFDGHSAPLTWKQSMLLRERAQKKFLTLRRGRRASRAVRRRREEMGLTADGPDDVESGAVDTKCPQCGKSYRQNNSFYKHLYEHHAKWDYVSETFNLSKHQQVMMMQGAELLLSLHQPLTQGLHPLVRF